MKYLLQIARDGRFTNTKKDGVLLVTEDDPEQQLILLCKSTEIEDYSEGIDVAKIIERLKIYVRAQQRFADAYKRKLSDLESTDNIKILVQNVGRHGNPDNEREGGPVALYGVGEDGTPMLAHEIAHIEETDDDSKKLGRMNRLYVMERAPRIFLFWNYNCITIVPPDPFARHCRVVYAKDAVIPGSDGRIYRF